MPAATCVIFQNAKVSVNYKDDYYSIIANEDLDVGTFVVLEHVISTIDRNNMCTFIMKDDDLFNTLYPRKFDNENIDRLFIKSQKVDQDIDYDLFVKSCQVQEKLLNNVFMFNEKYVLCNFISKFNHSCIPNCHMDVADNVKDKMFYGIWTHRKIKKNEELTIDYCQSGNVNHHNIMKNAMKWICNCTNEYIEANTKRAKIHMNIGLTSCLKCS